MPRESSPDAVGRQSTASRPDPRASAIEISAQLKEALRPWVDVDEVGSEGFRVWLLSVLPLLPPSRPGPEGTSSPDPEGRVRELAAALAECSGDRAKVHFQAAQYYRENQALARRVKALEAALEAAGGGAGSTVSVAPDVGAEEAGRRYLPSDPGSRDESGSPPRR